MRIFVNVSKSKKDDKWVIAALYFKGKKYVVETISNPVFSSGITIFDVEIGQKKTKLYLDEIDNRWFVIPKAA